MSKHQWASFTKRIFVLYARRRRERHRADSRNPATARQELHMPKLKPETMAARRDEILQAAEACFARQGFHQTTIADVIAQSGLSAGCIYGHFASKEELIQAIGEHRHARDAALLATAREISDPLEALRAIARALLADMQKEEGLRHRRIALQLWAEALRDDDIRAQVTDGVRKPAVLITELLQRGQRLGVIDRSVHPRSMARTIVAMFQGFVLQRLWGEPFSSSEAMAAFETLLTGLAARR
ncbi:TetR/AcrR family transcriptional regulator [Bradyrhizobium sp. SZCCHNRI2009]|uniref:TetR/AcrR family transcriptional regulator n=2 Tax=unclassified Bradyrhizobium TaxID=2631580 RepID=UPI002915CFF2|nr:TetR/AcrR family transcriptional regulator [Bradyrhizobium sp. SZCCHNRI2009]